MISKNKETLSSPGRFGFLTEPTQSVLLILNFTIIGEITTHIIRSTNYINWTGQLDERITTSATGYYQVYLRRFEDYRIFFQGSLTFRLTTKLAFPLRINFRYDSEPPTGIRKHDVEIFNGLRYTF